MIKYKLSPTFSSFIIKHFEEEKHNNENMSDKPIPTDVLRMSPEDIKKIRDARKALTVEQVCRLEKTYCIPISSFITRELEGKQIPRKLKRVHKAFVEFAKSDLKTPITQKAASQLSILEQEEELVEQITALKEISEQLKVKAKMLEARKLKAQKEQGTISNIRQTSVVEIPKQVRRNKHSEMKEAMSH